MGGSGKPIIVVPASEYPGNLTLKNVVQFLGDEHTYFNPATVKLPDTEKFDQKKTFTKKIGTDNVTFEVFDSVYSFSKKDWKRVVCIFTNGEPFQLKDWPPKDGDSEFTDQDRQMKIVNLFHRVKGFYLSHQDVVEPPIVKNWNVSRLIIQKNKRH